MAWDEMTATFGGGSELFTALWSTTVGTFGVHPAKSWEGEVQKFVGGHEAHLSRLRRTPVFPLYPFDNADSGDHASPRYESLMCTLGQGKLWLISVSSSDPFASLLNPLCPMQLSVRGISETIDPNHANRKVTLNLAFVDPS